MSVIVIYGFSGQYSGNSEYDWNHPDLGVTHKCILFLRQTADSDEYDRAEAECRRYGFAEIAFSRRGKLQVEVLNTDAFRGFAGFYQEALDQGSALVFYPNQAGQ
ncbi:hypothetical protein [Lysobacter sp. P5_B9]